MSNEIIYFEFKTIWFNFLKFIIVLNSKNLEIKIRNKNEKLFHVELYLGIEHKKKF